MLLLIVPATGTWPTTPFADGTSMVSKKLAPEQENALDHPEETRR